MNEHSTIEPPMPTPKEANHKKLILFIVILLILIAAGVMSYFIYIKNKEIDSLQTQINSLKSAKEMTEQKEATSPEGVKVYKDSSLSFNYPADWKVEEVNSEGPGLNLEITSPDFVKSENPPYSSTLKGGMIRVRHILSVYTQQSTQPVAADGDEEINSILNKTNTLSEHMSEISKERTINGKRSISYGTGYEGPATFTTVIDAKEGYFVVQYTDAPYANGSTNIKAAKYYKQYNSLVNSFKVIE